MSPADQGTRVKWNSELACRHTRIHRRFESGYSRVDAPQTREMDTSGVGDNRADHKSGRRDSLGGLSGDLGQVLPDAPPKCDDPKVAVAVLASQQNHRDAVFNSHDGRAARDARVAVSATIAGADWSEWLAGGEKALSFVDPPATKKRPRIRAERHRRERHLGIGERPRVLVNVERICRGVAGW